MTTSNLAVDASTDLKAHALSLRREWERVFSGSPSGHGVLALAAPGDDTVKVRHTVADSWRRLAGSGLHPDRLAPEDRLTDDALEQARHASPLHAALPVLRRCLGSFAEDSEHILVVADARGHLLWTEGHNSVLDATQSIKFKPGMLWDEASVGTNAIGTALATRHPVQIFSAEHFLADQHPWWCSAAPVHSPHTGELLGVIDLSGPQHTAHPHSLALVQAAAALVERELALQPAGIRATEWVRVMTRHTPTLALADGRTIPLSLRQAEVMVLLLMHPGGLSAEELTLLLYGDAGKSGSSRALMSRLRTVAGPALTSQPYRLAPGVGSDFDEVRAALRAGDVSQVLSGYDAPLLAESQVPAIEDRRREIDQGVRRACLTGTLDQQWSWLESHAGQDDLVGLEQFIDRVPPTDFRADMAHSRRMALLRDWG